MWLMLTATSQNIRNLCSHIILALDFAFFPLQNVIFKFNLCRLYEGSYFSHRKNLGF